MTQDQEIICERRGAAGFVLLNRPKALNALSHGMVRELARALDAWENDPAVTRIVVTASGEKAFCAGGDIRALHDFGKAGRQDEMLAFWREEYILNARIKAYPKPYISLIDGIVMGGGVGISLHGSHRVAGERYLFAMPEVGIGFFPDVGATFALPRLPDAAGVYLALTGDRVGQGDALALGLATHAAASARMGELAEALTGTAPVDEILAAFAQPVALGEDAGRHPRASGSGRRRRRSLRHQGARHHQGEIADQCRHRLRADAPRCIPRFRRSHGAGVPNRLAYRPWPGFL